MTDTNQSGDAAARSLNELPKGDWGMPYLIHLNKGTQPCQNFQVAEHCFGSESPLPHCCQKCDSLRYFCENCKYDHHLNGWESCKKDDKAGDAP